MAAGGDPHPGDPGAPSALLHFRPDHLGRFVLGGRGRFREPRGEAGWAHRERVVPELVPQRAGTPVQRRWCGRVALTRDFLPHLHEPEPGLLIDVGSVGRGVGLPTLTGMRRADDVATGHRCALPFPVVPVRPLHALHRA